jgi:hypothetical protein
MEQIQPINTTEEKLIQPIQPAKKLKCSHCPELEKQLEAVATLPTAYIDERETKLKERHQKEIEKLRKDYEEKIKELQQPINPTIEL